MFECIMFFFVKENKKDIYYGFKNPFIKHEKTINIITIFKQS